MAPDLHVAVYRARTEAIVLRQFVRDAERLRLDGWEPSSQDWTIEALDDNALEVRYERVGPILPRPSATAGVLPAAGVTAGGAAGVPAIAEGGEGRAARVPAPARRADLPGVATGELVGWAGVGLFFLSIGMGAAFASESVDLISRSIGQVGMGLIALAGVIVGLSRRRAGVRTIVGSMPVLVLLIFVAVSILLSGLAEALEWATAVGRV